ncbi:hypothetical protein BD626DRAFT_564981 [Schizophyllum amplum]|uniref:Yeast cell wall synthesis Kre9/Knh1-like N-terminal domain-containing protein n=1 Tax=Schizophyllum amplum TaxID=97359 RepID=A0A550CTJ4_9AGAR|nr:hypothetical protein BD626DRAFT_564981 [Auriculariopsis ampla]
MRTSAILASLSLAAFAAAFTVTQPSQKKGWTDCNSQTLKWDSVTTDASNFTVVLVNQDDSVLSEPVVLAENVDASKGSIDIDAPSDGWPSGDDFQVNLVQSKKQLTQIYAQSNMFDIKEEDDCSATTTKSSSQTSGTQSGTNTASGASASETGDNNGALSMSAQTGFFGVVALLGAALA